MSNQTSVSEITSRQQNQVAQTGVNNQKENIRNLSHVNSSSVVDVESKSLIKKAVEIKSKPMSEKKIKSTASLNSTPEKIISLADRAARINYELPKIEELADKENDTFAQGGPLQALKIARNISVKKLDQKEKERSHLRSADVQNHKYKMYREPGDRDSIGVGNLARG